MRSQSSTFIILEVRRWTVSTSKGTDFKITPILNRCQISASHQLVKRPLFSEGMTVIWESSDLHPNVHFNDCSRSCDRRIGSSIAWLKVALLHEVWRNRLNWAGVIFKHWRKGLRLTNVVEAQAQTNTIDTYSRCGGTFGEFWQARTRTSPSSLVWITPSQSHSRLTTWDVNLKRAIGCCKALSPSGSRSKSIFNLC